MALMFFQMKKVSPTRINTITFQKMYTLGKLACNWDNVTADYSVANLLMAKTQHEWSWDAQHCQKVLNE
jgi:hypothetical protein